MILKPEHPKILPFQPSCPVQVITGLSGMLPPIQFNNESFLETDKINDIGSKGLLPTELVPFHLTKTEVFPQNLLCHSQILPEHPGPCLHLPPSWPSSARGEGIKKSMRSPPAGTPRSRFWIFPVAVLGSASRNSINLGIIKSSRCLAQ